MTMKNQTLGAYLQRLFQAVHQRSARDGADVFTVHVRDGGLGAEEIEQLK